MIFLVFRTENPLFHIGHPSWSSKSPSVETQEYTYGLSAYMSQ